MPYYETRKYEPIWKALKTKGHATITAPINLHPRIKKAVIKEKYRDYGHKLTASEEGKRYKLIVIARKHILSFKLVDSNLINKL